MPKKFHEPEIQLRFIFSSCSLIAALVVLPAFADAPAETSKETWAAAAKSVIAKYKLQRDLSLVIGPDVSADAANAIAKFGKTIPENALPDREHYELPPGNFLLVRDFKRVGDEFKMRLTTGPILKGALNSCGTTTTYTIIRSARGTWEPSDLLSVAVC